MYKYIYIYIQTPRIIKLFTKHKPFCLENKDIQLYTTKYTHLSIWPIAVVLQHFSIMIHNVDAIITCVKTFLWVLQILIKL